MEWGIVYYADATGEAPAETYKKHVRALGDDYLARLPRPIAE